MKKKIVFISVLVLIAQLCLQSSNASAQTVDKVDPIVTQIQSNSPDRKKIKLNKEYYPSVPVGFIDADDGMDEANARRGYITGTAQTISVDADIPSVAGITPKAWDMPAYDFMGGDAPVTVNPVLWRMEKLNNINGLFQVWPKVEEGGNQGTIYQIRSYDLATMTIVKSGSSHGWIVIDPLGGKETAKAGWDCFVKNVDPQARLCAILITHSHVDHYKGVEGLLAGNNPKNKKVSAPYTILKGVTQNDFSSSDQLCNIPEGQVLVVAPDGFYDEALSENLYLGNCMSRRAIYMYGSALPRDTCGQVGAGLGKGVGASTGALLPPSFELRPEGMDKLTTLYIDGLKVQFQNVPGTEAPAEFHIYIDQYNALCPGENISHTMHNLLTSRGAKVRDPKAFATAIDRAIELFPHLEVIIGTHHWPTWDNAACIALMEKQRDMYRFFNDQVIRFVNKGMNMEEIAEQFRLPKSLDSEYYNRGYYGTVNHNVKAVVQRYVGWWDGNPANYFKYPDTEVARRFVADMGGEERVLETARRYFDAGDYRWTVELTRQAVFNNKHCIAARYLQADALEQLAYSFESATWRNIFLSAAFELRGKPLGDPRLRKPEVFIERTATMLQTLTPAYIFDYLATLVKGYEAGDADVRITVSFREPKETYLLHLRNGVLHYKLTTDLGETPDISFDNVKAFAEDFQAEMLALLNDREISTMPLRGLYQYLDTHNGQWNIIEPLAE